MIAKNGVRNFLLVVIIIIGGIVAVMFNTSTEEEPLTIDLIGVYFSPDGVCQEQILYWLSRANHTVDILMFSFTDNEIGDAVIDAGFRGVSFRIVFEKGQVSKYSEYWRVKDRTNILVRNDTNSGYMHHKVAIIDSSILLIGSYNWSVSAQERNNENLVIVNNPEMVHLFSDEFEKIWSEAL